MTQNQQIVSRFIWLTLAFILGATIYVNGTNTQQVFMYLACSLIAWCGGVAFVFACVAKVDR